MHKPRNKSEREELVVTIQKKWISSGSTVPGSGSTAWETSGSTAGQWAVVPLER